MADILSQSGAVPGAMEMQIQLQGIERQRKIAEMLQQQSLQAPQGQMISGHYVKPSGMEYLAKLAQGLVGASNQKDLDAKQVGLAKNQDDSLMKLAQALVGGGASTTTPASNTPQVDPPPMGLGSGMSGLGASDILPGDPVGQSQFQTPTLTGRGAPQSGGNGMFGNVNPLLMRNIISTPGGIAKLGEMQIQSNLKNGEFTDAMKNNRALGISNEEAATGARAAMKKAGMIEYQPGTTTEDLATGNQRFQPKVGEGISLADGVASALPGYASANAGIEAAKAGAVTSATEAAKQPFQSPTKVDLPGGPALMTPKQQIDMATGGAASAQGLDLSKLTPQQMQMLQKQDPQAFANGLADFGRTQGKPSAPGIALQSPESQAFNTKVATGAGEEILKTRDQAKGAADDLYGINESRKAIASGAFLGSGADFKTDTAKAIKAWIGMDIDSNKVTNTEYLRSTLGQRMLDNAKKLGVNPTDADAKRLDAIIGTIAKDPKALIRALDFQEEMNVRAIKQHNDSVAQAQKSGLQTPYDLTVRVPTFESRPSASAPKSSIIDFGSLK